MQVEYMSEMKWWMKKYHEKHDNMHYIKKNYVLDMYDNKTNLSSTLDNFESFARVFFVLTAANWLHTLEWYWNKLFVRVYLSDLWLNISSQIFGEVLSSNKY